MSDDEILERVAALPRYDAEPALAERIRTVALAEFSNSASAPIARSPAQPGLWTRFVEPALVLASVVAYLTWTASTLSSLRATSALAGEVGEPGHRGAR